MKRPLLFLLISSLLVSCSSDFTYYTEIQDATGLEKGEPVTIKGLVYGELQDLNLTKDGRVILELGFDKSYELPNDSRIVIRPTFVQKTLLLLEVGQSKEFLAPGDTLLTFEEQAVPADSIFNDFGEIIENVFTTKKAKNQRDSILKELKRLNENLEEKKK